MDQPRPCEDLMAKGGPFAQNFAALGFVSWIAADLTSMENVGEFVLKITSGDGQHHSRGWAHYFLACVHYQRNDLHRAQYHAQKTFDQRYVNHTSTTHNKRVLIEVLARSGGFIRLYVDLKPEMADLLL